MEYFKKISVKTPTQMIITCPIRIQEIAIFQDSFDKNILGRIIFVNQTKKNIIAAFFNLAAKDISGEPIALNDSSFIYQDMIISPGELYGNKIAINLPDNTRIFNATINKIVFENGDVWTASDAHTCPEFTLEQIDLPKENYKRIKKELTKIIPDVDYINYYYQENESAWLCSCGKINPSSNKVCSFCDCTKSPQAAVLTKEHFVSFCDNINSIVAKEREEADKIAAEERKQREEEKKQEEEEAKKEEARHKKERKRIVRRNLQIFAISIPFIIVIIMAIWGFYHYYMVPKIKTSSSYDQAFELMNDGDYQSAYDIFESLNGFKDSNSLASEAKGMIDAEDKYNHAKTYIDNGDYQQALDILYDIAWYEDSDKMIEEVEKQLIAENDDELNVYNDSNEVDENKNSQHISFAKTPKETQKLLESYVPADSIEISQKSSYTFITTDFTSKQAAQLMGMPSLENIKNIKYVTISFNQNDKMKRIRYDLSNLDKPASFYDVNEENPEIYKYIREIAYAITDSETTDISFSNIVNGDSYVMCYGKFKLDGRKYIINLTYRDNVWIQYIGIEKS